MRFKRPLISGTLIRRYKRFLADIRLDNGRVVVAHCPNSGSMKTCATPGWAVRISESDKPNRKLRYTWEMVHNGRCWIGVNTFWPNRIAAEAIERGKIPELKGYKEIRPEVPYGKNSRIDLLLSSGKKKCFVEVKNVSLVEADGFYTFPDAVTERGRKHLHDLMREVKKGHRAVMLFVIQRSDGTLFKPAAHIDPDYARDLKKAHGAGVEILSWRATVTPSSIALSEAVGFEL